ncbi:MAG TPA: FtsH protease activity modulator HflK [Alphaproteobacteria bacterium]
MPWNQGGGGGPWGGGGPSPWGRPSGGGGGFGGRQPPDIEEILRRSQDRVKRMLPGGLGSGRGIGLIVVIAFALWIASGFYRVQPDEVGVVLRFGEWVQRTDPGLRWHIPTPIETVVLPKVTRINSLDIGFRSAPDVRGGRGRSVPEEGLMLTGDENIIDIQYTVFWKIDDVGKYLFNIASPEATVKAASESAMRQVIGQMPAQFALAEGRSQIELNTMRLLQTILNDYGAGVLITQIQLRAVDPPTQVIDAFRDVQRAKADRERARNEAEGYRNDIVPRARGDAQRIIQEADAYRQQVIVQAEGEAQRFVSVYDAFKKAPDVTRQRLYLETMEQVLRNNSKYVIQDSAAGSQGVLPFLPLGDPANRRPAAGPPAQPSTASPAPPTLSNQGNR